MVGPSGGGKSTVARLITRFWDVSKGEIKIGGTNIKKFPLSQLADTVSFVTQDNFLFNYSIMENIRLGKPGASDEEVINAAKKLVAMSLSRILIMDMILMLEKQEGNYQEEKSRGLQ